jgi:tetratricopeptide (TPR) repeat protein
MNNKKFLSACSIIVLALSSPALAQAPLPGPLNQYVSDVQKAPNDTALREKIIKHVRTMKSAPRIPEEARRFMARGKAAFKGAREAEDFGDAAREFENALLAAPWLADGYYNLGITQDKSGQYAAAIESLRLYLLAAPDAPDIEQTKELIYEIEYRMEVKAKESSAEARANRERETSKAFLRSLDGGIFSGNLDVGCYGERHTVSIQGDYFVFRSRVYRSTCPDEPHTQVGYEDKPWRGKIGIIGPRHFSVESTLPWQCNEFEVSEDGREMRLYSGNHLQFGSNPFYRER